jgi:hypothetical protein
MVIPVQTFIDRLTESHRVVVLGGLAVIAHGYSRHTHDADVWLDPMESPEAWANALENVRKEFPDATVHRLPGWTEISHEEIAAAVDETGMVRVLGLSCPLDVFRRPNEYHELGFGEVVGRARKSVDGTYLPSPLDLIQSKLDTGRDKDIIDIQHLESLVREEYKQRLPTANLDEAREMLERFSEWQVLLAALENPQEDVRDLARTHLREFAAAGDPFSQAILEGREIP